MRAKTRDILRERDVEMARARREALRQKRLFVEDQEQSAARARVGWQWRGPFNGIRGL
jgi:hypothetical protein